MPSYSAPVDDYLFLFHDLIKSHEQHSIPGMADLDPESIQGILRGLGDFHEKVLHPLNQAGDQEGAKFVDGNVYTPSHFKALAEQYRDSGWLSAGIPESIGGAGLPPIISAAISEFNASTAQSFRMYYSFCAPAAEMLNTFGPSWMKEHVVPHLVQGDWTATMAMTESNCGTDLRQMRTRAEVNDDGTYRINGSKIFISGGDHDLADNIIHIVLAKMPGADGKLSNDLSSVGVFMVPKLGVDHASGALTTRNGVSVASIEHKMGLAGSATCVMNFEDAIGYRIAAPGTGRGANMAAMFFLMNYARVGVALSGVGYTEIAQQNAAQYARERLSGRAASGPVNPDQQADPIIVHPDIRRLLMASRSFAEGGRALAVKVAFMQSLAKYTEDKAEQNRLNDIMELLTPVMKAYFTDKGFECANDCLQVLGGHGYIAEYGLEHFVRNARVGQLYEGANGIQAIDLVKRKLTANEGRARASFFGTLNQFIDQHSGNPQMMPYINPLASAVVALEDTLNRADKADAEDVNAHLVAAYDILTMFGIVTVGWTWCEIVALILSNETQYLSDSAKTRKLALARLWMGREIPMVHSLAARALQGSEALMELEADLI